MPFNGGLTTSSRGSAVPEVLDLSAGQGATSHGVIVTEEMVFKIADAVGLPLVTSIDDARHHLTTLRQHYERESSLKHGASLSIVMKRVNTMERKLRSIKTSLAEPGVLEQFEVLLGAASSTSPDKGQTDAASFLRSVTTVLDAIQYLRSKKEEFERLSSVEQGSWWLRNPSHRLLYKLLHPRDNSRPEIETLVMWVEGLYDLMFGKKGLDTEDSITFDPEDDRCIDFVVATFNALAIPFRTTRKRVASDQKIVREILYNYFVRKARATSVSCG
jgi:hypothetical protein